MAVFPVSQHSWESEVKPINNTVIDTAESGAQHAYIISDKDWFDITLVTKVYHDKDGLIPNQITDFYNANKLQENIQFACKGGQYLGMFTSRPVVEQLPGFGLWKVTSTFRAERVS